MNYRLILILYILLNSHLYSQVDSSKSNYFPHHLGDTWIYSVKNGVSDDLLQVTIISDSSDIIGNDYVRHQLTTRNPLSQYPWYEYYKIDTGGNVFVRTSNTTQSPYNRLIYKADVQLGDNWAPDSIMYYATVSQVFTGPILGDTTTIKTIR